VSSLGEPWRIARLLPNFWSTVISILSNALNSGQASASDREPAQTRSGHQRPCNLSRRPPSRLTDVVIYDNIEAPMAEPRKTRPVSWIKAALKDFQEFPDGAIKIFLAALTIAAEGGKADIAKPMQGLGAGVFEIALPFRGDAFRVIYAVQIAHEIWVIHAFQKKSTQGIKTPKHEIDLIKDRLKRLKETLK
jgi:phage-related protein